MKNVETAELLPDKSRPSQTDVFEPTHQYYLPLKLDKKWWSQMYEICRIKQEDQERIVIAEKAKLVPMGSAHSNATHIADTLEIESQFNIKADEVIAIIENAKNVPFGPLKELLYQSNTTNYSVSTKRILIAPSKRGLINRVIKFIWVELI